MRWRRPLLKTVSDHVKQEVCYQNLTIYDVYYGKANAIMKIAAESTNYDAKDMGPAVPSQELAEPDPDYKATVSY